MSAPPAQRNIGVRRVMMRVSSRLGGGAVRDIGLALGGFAAFYRGLWIVSRNLS
jgi:hypothetical protein